jgi:mersacidin/lichenicidin family type 2 lantibiotic
MKKRQILEAWRNEEYYLSLSEEERARIPEHPSGLLDIEDEALRSIRGGCGTFQMCAGSTGLCTPCPPVECY